MPGLYSLWLGYVKKKEIELRAIAPRTTREEHRDKALYRSVLKRQVAELYNTPGRKQLKILDESMGRLEMEVEHGGSFSPRKRVLPKIQGKIKVVIRDLKKASDNRYTRKKHILKYTLEEFIKAAAHICKQIDENPDTDRFLVYTKKRVRTFISTYQRTIGKDLAQAQEIEVTDGV